MCFVQLQNKDYQDLFSVVCVLVLFMVREMVSAQGMSGIREGVVGGMRSSKRKENEKK